MLQAAIFLQSYELCRDAPSQQDNHKQNVSWLIYVRLPSCRTCLLGKSQWLLLPIGTAIINTQFRQSSGFSPDSVPRFAAAINRHHRAFMAHIQLHCCGSLKVDTGGIFSPLECLLFKSCVYFSLTSATSAHTYSIRILPPPRKIKNLSNSDDKTIY